VNHHPRKRFGQHFLHDPHVIDRLLRAIQPKPGESLVEIGPGQGALTSGLLSAAGELDVIELDRDLIPILQARCQNLGKLRVHQADALRFDLRTLGMPPPLRLIGNLPYNISTPLLFHLLEQADLIQDMYFMLQKEVVDRMTAQPGTADYGRLTIMLAWRCRTEALFMVAPGAFQPPPKVQSAVVRLLPHRIPPFTVEDADLFKRIVTQAFSQRRKILRNALRGLIPAQAWMSSDLDPERRPEQISPLEYAQLTNAVMGFAPDGKQSSRV